MSWAPTVRTKGDPKYYTNGLRFATEAEALASARALMMRWMAVEDYAAEERPDDPVNYRHRDGRDCAIIPPRDD